MQLRIAITSILVHTLAPQGSGFSLTPPIGNGHTVVFSRAASSLRAYPPRKNRRDSNNSGNNSQNDEDEDYDPILDEPKGKRGDGRNWIEKSSPTGIGKLIDTNPMSKDKKSETDGNYDLGIDGLSFQTGSLSTRMYDALASVAMKRFPPGTTSLPRELDDVYKLYAMDITAKEAVKAALDQNGMELALMNKDDLQSQDEGMWGDIGFVRLFDEKSGEFKSQSYECLDDAVEEGGWAPGQAFSFVARNVPAKLKEMDISELLTALDPEGEYRKEAKEKGITMPDEDIASLKDLGRDCERRTNVAPIETLSKEDVYRGDDSMGYNIMKKSDLLLGSRNSDGTENEKVLMHVMDSLVSHGCLVVDLSDGGTSSLDSHTLAKMWEVSDNFFRNIQSDEEVVNSLPKMNVAEGAGSPNAVVGFQSYNDAAMQFLETRVVRNESGPINSVVPSEVSQIIGEEGVHTLIDSFNLICNVGKNIVRVAVAASNMEYDGFLDENGLNSDNEEEMYIAADRMSSSAGANLVDDIVDDGKHKEGNDGQGSVSMSPHRLCKYINRANAEAGKSQKKQKEVFGAHTDTSFVTIVPVASTSGLEIFDEGADKWFRPELLARRKWELERKEKGLDPSIETEKIIVTENGEDKEINIPWHSRYICVMPGELLQVCTRNEVPAAVHRVVSAAGEDGRLSAPVLLRARSGMKMNVEKYFGRVESTGVLLDECDGMEMQEIHDALQPSSYQN
mmetsp:Transcript_2662/g.3837  ORF Transcript_2662/g.3837 Transcript_2662/m.3837 type:complete len:733 (-) Transcript_2662:104-2302(-)|eukprot:CAMPEP_0203676642 /NCGR_PEP_ID=MMETSP0090-20130426/25207_1 /ASSEMBLY_ACC=CAM_ASM_001088 /TAXON_ID=426623 /ORGANISM="Chaetoceros affinis, Strain CCMP159" /LENGTH=732 /DNA_ID=CAMNT_0050543241 /DNA_START=17 /DNA_END=2215 /DNA_ORIENTATION=+